jgi:ribosome-associated translation inhibitor RaiA
VGAGPGVHPAKELAMSTPSLFMDRVRLEDGYHEDDLPFIERTLTQLFHQLGRFDPSMVHIGLRVKDRGQPGMRTSVEVHVSGLPTVIGASDLTDTKAALQDAEAKVVSQLREAADRHHDRHPRRPQH